MKLRTYLTANGIEAADFAVRMGVTGEAVRLWCADERTPRAEAMRKIVEATNGQVTPNDFLTVNLGSVRLTASPPEAA